MPFNGNTAFFTTGTQLGLTVAQRDALAEQGLTVVDDFADFGKDELKEALQNMRTSIPAVAGIPAIMDNANNAIVVPAIQGIAAIPPILVSAKCMLRLKVASVRLG